MNKIIGLILLCFCISSYGNNDLILSNKTTISYPLPNMISHSGNMLIMKYDDWYFSHELIDPTKIYPAIDLSGLEREFIKSLFDASLRQKFPKWLAELSIEQANVFGISNNNFDYKKFKEIELYSIFNADSSEANIFIFEENQIHHINFNGAKRKYTDLINTIKER